MDRFWGGFWYDLRFAARGLRRNPGYALAVTVTLGLGIGATTAIFGAVDRLVLRPLPFAEPERLVTVTETVRRDLVEDRAFSYPDFLDLAAGATAFDGLAAVSDATWALGGGERAERVEAEVVSPGYFAVLGAPPALGRGFETPPESSHAPGEAPREAVLGDGLWRRRFGADPGVLGREVRLDGDAYLVVGVAAAGFGGLSGRSELWTPFEALPAGLLAARGSRWHSAVGRLAPGVGVERAGEDAARVFRRLEETYPDDNAGYGAAVRPLHATLLGDLERPLLLLQAAVALVLAIACANVANLQLVRAAGRRRERAVRTALGAGRRRLFALAAAESALLGLAGGALGLGVAVAGTRLLAAVNPVDLPGFVEPGIDRRLLGFAALVALAVVVGLAAAITLRGGDAALPERLKEGERGGSPGAESRRARSLLVVGEVALALVVAVGAGLTAETFRNLQGIELGFAPERLLTFGVDLAATGFEGADQQAFAERLAEQIAGAPAVGSVALTSDAPFADSSSAAIVSPEGLAAVPGAPYGGGVRVYRHRVTPGYFAALGTPLVRGRDFGPGDAGDQPDAVILSSRLAGRLWPGEDPVGRRLKPGPPDADTPWMTVVGVAGDLRHRTLFDDPERAPTDPDLYLPFTAGGTFTVVARTRIPPAMAISEMRATVARLHPDAVAFDLQPMSERVGRQTAGSRFASLLMGGFAALALALAAIGLYGVMAFAVAQRTTEIGIRMALGARRGSVLGRVLGQGMALVAAGAAVGLALALALGGLAERLLYGIAPTDPGVLAATAAILAGVALAACWVPASRACRVDPIVALRHE